MRNSGHPGNVPDGNPVFEAAFNVIWDNWQCFYDQLLAVTSGNPILTGNPDATMDAPYPSPVIAPFQPGQPVVVENPPSPVQIPVVPILIGAAGLYLMAQSVTRKKIIIKQPVAPVKIIKK
jgi:hypothetical protein